MKADVHPTYEETVIKCACGNEIKVRATVKDLHVEICSNCHPFYTKKNKIIDTAGRVEKFKKKYNIKN